MANDEQKSENFDEICARHQREHRAARERVDRLIEELRTAYVELDRAARNNAWDEGFRAAFDGMAKVAQEQRNAVLHGAGEAPKEIAPPQEDSPRAADVVLEIVGEKPGMRGVDIVSEAERRGTPLKERTVRTALWRLKTAEKLRNSDERWYLVDADPALAARSDGDDRAPA
jgi:hypothetical protein